jgi:hypothetical protein
VNLRSIQLNTEFKHTVSYMNDLKVASHKVSDVRNRIKEQEQKRVHSSSHSTYSIMVYICLVLIRVYTLYTLIYGCFKDKLDCTKAITNHQGSRNMINIKIRISNKSLAMAQEELPLHKAPTPINDGKVHQSNSLRSTKSRF